MVKRTSVVTMLVSFLLMHLTVHEAIGQRLPAIFNGQDFDGWQLPPDNIWFEAADGILQVRNGPDQKGKILWTKKTYSNFVLELEFRFGEGTVDSGVFVRNETDQIQLGISGSLKRDMTCSPYIAGKGYPVEATGVGKLLKPKDWNRLTLVVIGNSYKVWLNGKHVMTYDSDTPADPGPVGLQLHSGREMGIDYRDIRLAELAK